MYSNPLPLLSAKCWCGQLYSSTNLQYRKSKWGPSRVEWGGTNGDPSWLHSQGMAPTFHYGRQSQLLQTPPGLSYQPPHSLHIVPLTPGYLIHPKSPHHYILQEQRWIPHLQCLLLILGYGANLGELQYWRLISFVP